MPYYRLVFAAIVHMLVIVSKFALSRAYLIYQNADHLKIRLNLFDCFKETEITIED